jgi:D-3-phosphoglycerate dehydrogenase
MPLLEENEEMSQPKVVITDSSDIFTEESRALIMAAGMELVDAERDRLDPLEAAQNADGLLVGWFRVPREVLSQLRRCKVIVRLGVGYDIIDAGAARELGIAVCNVPDYCTHEVADHAVALTLTLVRRINYLDACVRKGIWKPQVPMQIHGLHAMTFAILGLGRIGRAVAQRMRGFGCKLVACDPYVPDSVFETYGVKRLSLEELLSAADILSLHVPLNAETHHILTAERLSHMKPGAILINTARGALVDTKALAALLERGHLAGAGLDVFEEEPPPPNHPLLRAPNTVLTTHYAWLSEESRRLLPLLGAEEVIRGVRGEPLRSCVN